MLPHEIVSDTPDYKIIRPEQLALTTYPYEWCFSLLKDAALLTLNTHLTALEYGMVLKDASAFNVQFHNGKPVFIDTLSFDTYHNGDPWTAYGQFCRHFLAPLLLMRYISPDLNKLQIPFLDGIPLEVASVMLPTRTHFSPMIKANIHMHAKAHKKHKQTFATKHTPQLPLDTHKNMIVSMISFVENLTLNSKTEWGDYYRITNYADDGFKFKEETVRIWIQKYSLKKIWDIGGNNGHFSRLLQDHCDMIICTDIDPVAVDVNYRTIQKKREHKIIPLLIDYTNPSPGLGFDNKERTSLFCRIQDLEIDCVMALALIHHLSISSNCTFEMLASSLSETAKHLLIEFVDPTDSWADKLLSSKRSARDLFAFYNKQNFEAVFSQYYKFVEAVDIPKSKRSLYFMARKTTK